MERKDRKTMQKATFAAGCFWCVEAIFQDLKGVEKVVSGYTGGHVANPTYEQVCTGETGHAEAVQITFDPEVVTYEDLLDVFWRVHDPTTPNRQGADVGPQYRSAVFYHDDEQKRIAERSRAEAAGLYRDPIVTEIVPAGTFYNAEVYHQNFYRLNPGQPYCRAVIEPKVRKFRKVFADALKDPAAGT